jgi:hypothetical protein
MNEKEHRRESGQSIVIVAMAVIVLLIFVVIAVDLAYAYVHRRGDQNAADAASLGGAQELARQLNHYGSLDTSDICYWPNCSSDQDVKEAMNAFAERNGIEDTGGSAEDAINTNVEGYYLAADGTRLSNQIQIGNYEFIPSQARGVEAIVHSTAPSFFGGVVGLDGLPIRAEAAVAFQGGACYEDCIAPIATLTMTFVYTQCYNIWDGPRQTSTVCSKDENTSCSGDKDCYLGPCQVDPDTCPDGGPCCQDRPYLGCSEDSDCDMGTCIENPNLDEHTSMSGLGWLNWTLQGDGHSCMDVGEPNDCSSECTSYNLKPSTCLSGGISAGQGEDGDWVAGGAGVKNDVCIRKLLTCFIPPEENVPLPGGCPSITCPNPGEKITVVVYDRVEGTGCNQDQNPGKMRYHVVGFARFQILGYELAQGGGNAAGHDGVGCLDYGGSGNRITGVFDSWYSGMGGDCDPIGTITGSSMIK